MRKKETTKAPKVEESALVEETQISLSNIQKQCGITVEDLSSIDYSPSVELKLMFADIMETMHNYHMSCENKNQARYNDIMNHIVTSCELVNTFVR